MADEVVFRAHDEVPKDWAEKMAWSLFERGKVASPNIIADAFRHARNQALEEAANVADEWRKNMRLAPSDRQRFTRADVNNAIRGTAQMIGDDIRAMIK